MKATYKHRDTYIMISSMLSKFLLKINLSYIFIHYEYGMLTVVAVWYTHVLMHLDIWLFFTCGDIMYLMISVDQVWLDIILIRHFSVFISMLRCITYKGRETYEKSYFLSYYNHIASLGTNLINIRWQTSRMGFHERQHNQDLGLIDGMYK